MTHLWMVQWTGACLKSLSTVVVELALESVRPPDLEARNFSLHHLWISRSSISFSLQHRLLTYPVCQESVINKTDMEGEGIPNSVLGEIRKFSRSEG